MKKFLSRIITFTIPFVLVIILYFALDPFKVIWCYDSFYDINAPGRVILDMDYVSTSIFEKNYKTEKYNSFIFGNSRSRFFQISEWKKYIGEQNKCYHFDASLETLYGIHQKIKFLNDRNVKIENALLILDNSILKEDKAKTGHLFMIPPQLVNYNNFFAFHKTFIKAFCNLKFLYAFLDLKITNQVRPYMKKGALIEDYPLSYDVITNEMRLDYFDRLILENEYYTKERMKSFYERDPSPSYYEVSVKEPHKELLEEIHRIFTENKTRYKIVISPLYDQKKIAREDLNYLKKLFGDDSVFDFSGVNEFTESYRNYYENSHFRPRIAGEILRKVYSNN